MQEQEIGFKIKTNFKNEKNIDLVFASDYFEHFESPIKHLNEVLKVNPKLIVVANSFGSVSVGHFNIYPFAKTNAQAVDISNGFFKVFSILSKTSLLFVRASSCPNKRKSFMLSS